MIFKTLKQNKCNHPLRRNSRHREPLACCREGALHVAIDQIACKLWARRCKRRDPEANDFGSPWAMDIHAAWVFRSRCVCFHVWTLPFQISWWLSLRCDRFISHLLEKSKCWNPYAWFDTGRNRHGKVFPAQMTDIGQWLIWLGQDGRKIFLAFPKLPPFWSIYFVYKRSTFQTPTSTSSPNNVSKSCWLGYVVAVVRKKPAKHVAIDLLYDKHEEHFQHLPTCSKLHDARWNSCASYRNNRQVKLGGGISKLSQTKKKIRRFFG